MDNLPYTATPYAAGFELAQADADAEELRAQAAAAQRFAGAAQQVGQQVLRGPVGGGEQLAAAANALPPTSAAPAAPAAPAPEVLSLQVPTPMLVQPTQVMQQPPPQASVPAYSETSYTQYAPMGAQPPFADPKVPPPAPAVPGPGRGGAPERTGLNWMTFGGVQAGQDAILRMMGGTPGQPAGATGAAAAPPGVVGEPAGTSWGTLPLSPRTAMPAADNLEMAARGFEVNVPMVGARRVNMDSRVQQGTNDMRSALDQLLSEYRQLGEQAVTQEKLYQTKADEYRAGLEALASQGAEMRGTRGVERQIEAQETAAARMAFDANRVYQDLSQSPLQTGMLAVAAGIVQGLQGYAGQDKPNAIIAAVQEAAQRDLANQVEQYKRMQSGQQVARNNFMEARQALQDDQQALQVTAMATLDQINKGLEFIKARTARAKERADIGVAQGKLDYETGIHATEIAMKNADREFQAAHANQQASSQLASRLLQARSDMAKLDSETRNRAAASFGQWSKTDDGRATTEGIANAREFYKAVGDLAARGKTDAEINSAISKEFLDELVSQLRISAGNFKGSDGKVSSAMASAFESEAARIINKSSIDPEEKAIRGLVARAYSSYLRGMLGKSQTSTEMVNAQASVDLRDANSVKSFMQKILTDAEAQLNMQKRIDPTLGPVIDASYGVEIDLAKTAHNRIGEIMRRNQKL